MQIQDHDIEREKAILSWIQANPEIYELFSPDVLDYDTDNFLSIVIELANEGYYSLLYILIINVADYMDEVREANKIFFMYRAMDVVKTDLPKYSAVYIEELKRQKDLFEGMHIPRVKKNLYPYQH